MTRFAQKPWSRVSKRPYPELADSSLQMFYSFDRDSASFYDASPNGFSMLKGAYWTARSLLGNGLTAREAGANTGVLNATVNPSTDNHTVACWVPVRYFPASNTRCIIGRGVGGANYSFPPMGGVFLTTTGVRYSHYTGAAYQLSPNVTIPIKMVHLVYVVDHTNTLVSLYVDSHLAATLANTTITSIAAGDGFRVADDNNSSTLHLPLANHGEVVAPAIYSEAKDQAWVTKEYQKGASAIQFRTDWGHKADGIAKGPDDRFSEVIVGASGTGRCTTSTINGRTVKVLESQSFPFVAVGQYLGVASVDCSYGSWSWWAYTNGVNHAHAFLTDDIVSQGYFVGVAPDGSGGLFRIPGSVVLEAFPAGTFDVSNPIHLHVTRRYDNRFIVHYNGTALSAGIVDGSYTDLRYFTFNVSSGGWTAIADEKGQYAITKYLGVVPPKVN